MLYAFSTGTLALLFILLLPVLTLTARDENNNICYQRPVRPGDHFTIRYTHSVARRPVDETFTITPETQIMLTETTYDSFGAGLPFEPYQNQQFFREPGKFKISGYHTVIPVLEVRVGRFADHRLLVGGKDLPLSLWVQPGRPVAFTVEHTRLYQYLHREVGLWRNTNRVTKEQ